MATVLQQVAALYDQSRATQGVFDSEGKARTEALGQVLELLKKAAPTPTERLLNAVFGGLSEEELETMFEDSVSAVLREDLDATFTEATRTALSVVYQAGVEEGRRQYQSEV